jgi:serine O-acetyltransferase
MITTLEPSSIAPYVKKQLQHMFPDDREEDLGSIVPRALDRLEHCLSPIKLPSYHRNGNVLFNHLHSEQYATFLYVASNVAWRDAGNVHLAAKLFCLNKALNGIVCMYDTILPDIFLIAHSVGIVLGKATYADYLVVHQNVTVGTDRGRQPRLGAGVVLFGGAAVIGDCDIGCNVSISAHSTLRKTSVPAGHIAAGMSPTLVIKPAKRVLVQEYFDLPA